MKAHNLLLALLLFSGCATMPQQEDSTIISMQIMDKNGFAETISSKDRLNSFQKVDFLKPQPYQKIMRIYGKDEEGQNHSKITSYHQNGHVWQYLEVVGGRAHGLYEQWFENGRLHIEAHVIEGVADINEISQASWVFDGPSRVWDEEGNLIALFHYEKGVLDAPAFTYYPNGQLEKVIPYDKGELVGETVIFNKNGELSALIPYVKNQKQGRSLGFWDPENLMWDETYQEDLLLQATYFNSQGDEVASICEGAGVQALFQGESVRSRITYKKGVPEGQVLLFRPDGSIESSCHIKGGKKEGEETEYYYSKSSKEPRPKLSIEWMNDKMQGQVKTWYENGQLESQREVNGDQKQGLSFGWYLNGDLMCAEEYENNLLIKGSYFKKGDKKPVSIIESGKGTATLFSKEGLLVKKIPYEKGKPQLES